MVYRAWVSAWASPKARSGVHRIRGRLLAELAGYMGNQLFGVPDKRGLQIDAALVCQDHDRPQAVRQLVAEFRLAIIDIAHAGVRLDKLCQVAHVADETKREL